jgi:CheY-like chemotaxis protein
VYEAADTSEVMRFVSISARAAPRVVSISNAHGFAHLVRTLLQDFNVSVRTSPIAEGAVRLVEQLQPDLLIVDLVPDHETDCWLVVEALQARPSTKSIPLLLCPVVPWLLEGHEQRLAQHGVRTWCEPFDLRDLLKHVEAALDEQIAHGMARPERASAGG